MPTPFNIVDHFLASADKFPEKTAIVSVSGNISFRELALQVKDTSAYFLSKGIQKGDRVMIFVPMSNDLYRIVLALFNIGATAVFLDEWVSKKRLEACCEVAQCRAFIGSFKIRILSFLSSELRKIPIKLGVGYKKVTANGNLRPKETVETDTALITFTTGTTGVPKAAKRTHGFLNEQFKALLEKIDPQPEDIDMPALPIVLLINLGAGCTSVIADFKASKMEAMDSGKIIRQIQENTVTRMVGSPYFVKKLALHVIEHQLNLPSLTKIFTGGAPVFPSEAKLYLKAFPEAKIEIVYGSTEAEPISAILAKDLVKMDETVSGQGLKVGFPYRKAKVKTIKITDEPIVCSNENALDLLTLPIGEIGEIIVSGPHVLSEYFNNPEALKQNKIFIGETCWHRTGDSGYFDNSGMIHLTGRSNTLIRSENGWISPFIYENYFQQIEGVEMGTVLEIDGKRIVFIELRAIADRAKISAVIRDTEVNPDEIKFIPKMPRDLRHHSRIDYARLKNV